ncbi:MAG: hypothetical protein AB8B53_01910 [Flavobacteriales bacterium]
MKTRLIILALVLLSYETAGQTTDFKSVKSELDSLFELNNDSTSCLFQRFPDPVLNACRSISDTSILKHLFSYQIESTSYEYLLVIYCANGYMEADAKNL